MDMRDRRSTYQIGTITREQTSPNTVNWATHIDGSRRNHATLRAAKRHIDRVSAGEVSDGLHECRIHHTPLVCPTCIGAAGGKATSEAKAHAARENGKKGGRPKKARTSVS